MFKTFATNVSGLCFDSFLLTQNGNISNTFVTKRKLESVYFMFAFYYITFIFMFKCYGACSGSHLDGLLRMSISPLSIDLF